MFKRAIEAITDWVMAGLGERPLPMKERPIEREIHTWTPTYKQDPL